MKKFLLIALSVILLSIVGFLILDKPLPEGKPGPNADALARRVMNAVNHSAWQNTSVIAWTFPGGHQHLWDKDRHIARVVWDDYEVLVDLDSVSGQAFRNGQRVSDTEEENKLVSTAWEYWVNDSFWLNAPNKLFDPGVERSLVQLENGEDALLVTYTTGGATPGDAYLWLLDKNDLPRAWKLWVSIIPIGGVEFSWEDWQTLESGARIATFHDGLLDIKLEDIRAANRVEDLTGTDPFKNF